jgi:hypothetical protein
MMCRSCDDVSRIPARFLSKRDSPAGIMTSGFMNDPHNSASVEKGRTLVKQMRSQLIEAVRPVIEAMIQQTTGVKVVSLHHDISTVTGEEVLLFTLAESPDCRQPKKRNDRAVNRGVSRR